VTHGMLGDDLVTVARWRCEHLEHDLVHRVGDASELFGGTASRRTSRLSTAVLPTWNALSVRRNEPWLVRWSQPADSRVNSNRYVAVLE
jgi:hypothetical protein